MTYLIVKQIEDDKGYIKGYKTIRELIRCKDCVWFRHEITGNGFCEKWDDFFTEHDGYCYRGKRREE